MAELERYAREFKSLANEYKRLKKQVRKRMDKAVNKMLDRVGRDTLLGVLMVFIAVVLIPHMTVHKLP